MAAFLLNQLRAVSVRLLTPWRGFWIADVDLDLDATAKVPTGKVALTIGDATPLVGTVDPKASGRFGDTSRVRVLAGGGGWPTIVGGRHFHNDAGVLSTGVYSATAAEVGETVVDTSPGFVGRDYVRPTGPASSVFEGLDWFVTLQGVTIVGKRPPLPPSPSLEVLSWDPAAQRAEIATDALVQPGTVLVDPRFGTATIRDVEQSFSDGGARAVAWCSEAPSSRLVDALAAFVRAKAGLHGAYRYRVVLQGVDGRLNLQAIDKSPGLPHLLPITMWPGVPGVSAMLKLSSTVLVEFIGGDRTKPIVTGFEPGKVPLSVTLDAVAIQLGDGAVKAVATAPELLVFAANVVTALGALGQTVAPLSPTVAATKAKAA